MLIIKYKGVFFALTAVIVLAAIAAIAMFGLPLGSDFTGGTLVRVEYPSGRPAPEALQQSLDGAGFKGYSLRETGTSGYVLRTGNLSESARANLSSTLSVSDSNAVISQLTEVGPTVGAELRNKSIVALALVLLCIVLFIAFAFRKVSEPVSSWVYGLIALVALLHDVIVPVGFYAALAHFTGAEVDTLFVTAVLTVLGFSVHDTIVVFDRVRENLRTNRERNRKESFAETAGRSLGQTFVRSVNTSLTVVLTLCALYYMGPVSTETFSLTLLIGIIAGTYSSIFLATPLLVAIEERSRA